MNHINKIWVAGDPKALKRHRTFFKNGIRINIDPSKDDKSYFLVQVLKEIPETPIQQALKINMTFYFARPKSHYGTGKNAETLKNSAPTKMTNKPDIDNLIKFVLDAMNKVFFKDDSQIEEIQAKKTYTTYTPGTEIEIIWED